MKFRKRTADPKNPDDKEKVLSWLQWAIRWNMRFGGFYFSDELISIDGIHLCILCPDDRKDETKALEDAIKIGRAARDVVSYSVLIFPKEWEEEAFKIVEKKHIL